MQASTYFFLRGAILVASQLGVFDQTCQLMQALKALLEGAFGQFSQGKLVGIVADILEYRIEVILVEDELYKSLSGAWKLALDFRLLVFLFGLLLDLVISIIVPVIVLIILLEESVFSFLGRFGPVFPFVARFVLELLVEFFEGRIEIGRTDLLGTSELTNTAPASMCVELAPLCVLQELQAIELGSDRSASLQA